MLTAVGKVAQDLTFLETEPMFFGAAVLELYVDRPEMLDSSLRPTEDVDVVVTLSLGLAGRQAVPAMEAELRRRGFVDDPRPHRRNIHAFISPSGVAVDVVMDAMYDPMDWPLSSRDSAQRVALPSGREVLIPAPAYYLACKVSASRSERRWEGDYYSHDLEDIALLLAGCSAFPAALSHVDERLGQFLQQWATEVVEQKTEFGRKSYSVLMTNLPAAASDSGFVDLLAQLAGRPTTE